jgi:hypothetical protein
VKVVKKIKLASNENLFHTIFEAVNLPITLINNRYECEWVNACYCRAQGTKPSDFIGNTVSVVWGQAVFDGFMKENIDRCLEGYEVRKEAWVSFSTRRRCYCETVYSPYMSHDGYINCGPSCSVTYQSERVITFTATANEGSTFIGWNPASPNCSGTDPCAINLRGNTITKIKAIFVGDYALKVVSQGKKGGNGTLTSIPSSIHCITGSTAGCEAPYGYGEEVTLTASADIGSTFLGWKPSKLCPGTGDCTVTMDRKRTIKAVFSGQ